MDELLGKLFVPYGWYQMVDRDRFGTNHSSGTYVNLWDEARADSSLACSAKMVLIPFGPSCCVASEKGCEGKQTSDIPRHVRSLSATVPCNMCEAGWARFSCIIYNE